MVVQKLANHLKNSLNLPVFAYEAPKETKTPCIIYQITGQNFKTALNGGILQANYSIQLDTFTATFKEAMELSEKITETLLSFKRPIININCEIDRENDHFYLMVEFDFFV